MKFKRNPQYFYWGVTVLCVMVIGIILWVVFSNLPGFFSLCNRILQIVSPVIYGIVIAYILNPVMVFTERRLQPLFRKWKFSEKHVRSVGRGVSVVVALLVGIAAIYGFFALLLPNLVDSVTGLVSNMPEYYETAKAWVQNLAEDYPEYSSIINTAYEKIFEGLENWFQVNIIDNMESLVRDVTTQVYSFVKSLMNILIGVVAAIYILISKEKFLAQAKKIIVAFMKRGKADRFLEVCSHSNKMFSGFITGKILDSLIIGFLCYIGMNILRLPYPPLVATIIGVTNVIPFFGPIIGAVPSALLILLVDPLKAVYFLIFVLALQQLDGNVIGPRILGDAVGLPSFWILVSITIFGGMFGFVGMLLGVPVFAVIYMLVREGVERRLEEKGAPLSTSYYYHMSRTADLEKLAEEEETPAGEGDITEEELKQAEQEFWK